MQQTVPPLPAQSETQLAAQSLIPVFADDPTSEPKSRYLSYLFCGFSIRESKELAGIQHEWSLRRWRKNDPQFAAIEQQAWGPDRAKIRQEIVQCLFLRNYRRVLDKDAQVIEAAVSGDMMTKQDHDYLLRARAHYTPQQMQILEQLLTPHSDIQEFDINKFILEAVNRRSDGSTEIRRVEVQRRVPVQFVEQPVYESDEDGK